MDRTPPAISVVIPAYNEETRLPPTLRKVVAYFDARGLTGEVVVVDDGSRDRTIAVARTFSETEPRVKVVDYGRNRGKGYAVRTGVLAATGEAVLFSDADLSTPIEELDLLWPHLGRGYDVAIASRHLARSRILVRQPVHRRYLGRVFNGMISLLGVRGYTDTQCGFKLFRGEAARRLFRTLRTDGFAFDVEILLRARELGLRVKEVPVRWLDSGESRVHPVRDAGRMLLEILRMRKLI